MYRLAIKHITIWAIVWGLEILAYKSNWSQPLFWSFTCSNIAIALLVFYLCRYFGQRICIKAQNRRHARISDYREFWGIVIIAALFIAARLITDLILFYSGGEYNIINYSILLLRGTLTFVLIGFLLGLGEKRKQLIASLYKKQDQLKLNIESLEIKGIHLNDDIEKKEAAIGQMEDKIGELQFNTEMLTRDLDHLETTIQKQDKRISEQSNTINNNDLRIQQLDEENKLLQQSKATLEQEISNRQNYILVLKAELLGGLEDYRHLVRQYSDKADKLRRYQDIYGELDDEE